MVINFMFGRINRFFEYCLSIRVYEGLYICIVIYFIEERIKKE